MVIMMILVMIIFNMIFCNFGWCIDWKVILVLMSMTTTIIMTMSWAKLLRSNSSKVWAVSRKHFCGKTNQVHSWREIGDYLLHSAGQSSAHWRKNQQHDRHLTSLQQVNAEINQTTTNIFCKLWVSLIWLYIFLACGFQKKMIFWKTFELALTSPPPFI